MRHTREVGPTYEELEAESLRRFVTELDETGRVWCWRSGLGCFACYWAVLLPYPWMLIAAVWPFVYAPLAWRSRKRFTNALIDKYEQRFVDTLKEWDR